MDAKKHSEDSREALKEFIFGRARLYRVGEEKRVKVEIEKDKRALFSLFEAQGKVKQLEYVLLYKRLFSNWAKVASYNGIRQGYRIKEEQLDEMSDATAYHIFIYLFKRPQAKNEEIVRYLDRECLRLSTLTNGRGPLFAPLPDNIRKICRANQIQFFKGQQWQDALSHPLTKRGLTEYLSRRRAESREPNLKNMLVNWPRLFKLHNQQRKAKTKLGQK
jgi:hypothetical protein